MQILGGAGYLRGQAIERIYREVKVMAIGGGSEEIMASTFSCKVAFKNIVRAEVPSGAGARVLAERARYVKQRLYKHIAARLPFHCRVHRADRTNIR